MNYFNNQMTMPPMPRPLQQMVRQTQPQLDPQQFKQFAMTLNDSALAQFAQQARAQGISEQDI